MTVRSKIKCIPETSAPQAQRPLVHGETTYGKYVVETAESDRKQLRFTLQVLLPRKVSSQIVASTNTSSRLAMTVALETEITLDASSSTEAVLSIAKQYTELAESLKQNVVKNVEALVESLKRAAEECSRAKCAEVEGWAVVTPNGVEQCIQLREGIDEKTWAVLKNVAVRVAFEALAEAATDAREKLLKKQLQLLENIIRLSDNVVAVVGVDVAAKLALVERVEKRVADART